MSTKYKSLSSPEIYFKDCFRQNKTVCCQDTVFIQKDADITEYVYTQVFPTQRDMLKNKDSYFGVGLIIQDKPELMVSDVRSRISSGIKTIPADRFILTDMDVSICRILRYAQFNVAFESVVISYVFDGEYTIKIGGATYRLGKGNLIVIAPNVSYSAIINDDDTVVFNLMIRAHTFTNAFLNLITENNSASKFLINMLFNKEPPPYAIFRSPPDDKLSGVLLQLFDFQDGDNLSVAMNNTLTQLFICQLFYYYEEYIQNRNSIDRNDILVADIVSYLHKNYSTTSLQDLSKQFSFSAKYLSRILKERAGMSYMSLVAGIKLDKAKEFLKNTDLSIGEICSILGYTDSRQLRLIFSQKYGMSPSEYRRRIK